MKKIEINVVNDILKGNTALHTFGERVSPKVNSLLEIEEPTLFIINLREADPLDYEFINIAFASLFRKFKEDQKLYIVVMAGKYERDEVYTGITKIFRLKSEKGKTDRDLIVADGIHLIVVDDKNILSYITDLDEHDLKILLDIENRESVRSDEIKQKFNLTVEQTSEILSKLKMRKFIYSIDGSEILYYPISKLI